MNYLRPIIREIASELISDPELNTVLVDRIKMMEILNCKETKFRELCLQHNLPYYEVGGKKLYRPFEILPYFKKHHGEDVRFKGLEKVNG
jgi:hypothetical protein